MSDKEIKRGFNFLASFYDALLFMCSANSIIRSQIGFIPLLNQSRKVLLMGDGTGNFLKHLLLKSKPEHIVSIDISGGMILKAKEKITIINHQCAIDFREGSFELIGEDEKFELIVCNYFLDLFPPVELQKHLALLYNHLEKDGIFYVTDFNSELSGWRNIFKPLISLLYLFFRLVCRISGKKLPPIFEEIKALNMKLIASKNFFCGLLRSVLYKNS